MQILMWVLVACDLTWLYLALFHGRFWSTSVRVRSEYESYPGAETWPSVAVVVPARDEAAVIAGTVRSLLMQSYPGRASLVLVDDRSSDGTATIAEAVAQDVGGPIDLRIVPGSDTPPGWMGKLWALSQGTTAAEEVDYYLFTDADIVHHPDSLRRLVSKALRDDTDQVSLMAKLRSDSAWERLLVPAFVYFFAQLYPFRRVNSDRSRTAAAAGGCILVRRESLSSAGGIETIRSAVIDDVSLGSALKRKGFRVWLGFADDREGPLSTRAYGGLSELWNMVARSAFTQLRHSYALLLGTVAGLLFVYVLPVAGVVAGAVARNPTVALLGAAAWLIMALTYAPMLRYYGQSPLRALLLPFTASLYLLMTVDSARRHLLGRSVSWKGRTYSSPGACAGKGT